MKKLILPMIALSSLIYSCQKEPIPTPNDKEEPSTPYTPSPQIAGRVALAYVTYWGTTIPDTRLMTHLSYAFAELVVRDGVYKGFELQGKEERFRKIVALKESAPALKILIAFTHVVDNPGNIQGGSFSAMASTSQGRKAFALDCKAFIEKWGIDGVDIDWEFPGLSWSGAASDPAIDTHNFTLLIKELRETLGSNRVITYAGYVKDKVTVQGGFRYIDVKAVDPYVDFVNIMTYNMDAAPKHHSALSDSRAYWDCVRAVNSYRSAGVDYNKMVLGIPFYGQHSFSEKPTSLDYKTIKGLDPSQYKIDNWDPISNTPYVTKNGLFFCGYDNPKSIDIKGKWAISLGLKGLMYWQYDGDDAQGTLRRAVWESIMAK